MSIPASSFTLHSHHPSASTLFDSLYDFSPTHLSLILSHIPAALFTFFLHFFLFFSSPPLSRSFISLFFFSLLFSYSLFLSYSPPPLSSFFSLDIPSLFCMPCSFYTFFFFHLLFLNFHTLSLTHSSTKSFFILFSCTIHSLLFFSTPSHSHWLSPVSSLSSSVFPPTLLPYFYLFSVLSSFQLSF